MSTELTTPHDQQKIIHTQDIPYIHMSISNGQLEYHVDSYDEDGEVLGMKAYILNFADAPPAVKDHLRAVLDDVRGHARANGYLGEGTDTDPIG